MIDVDSNNLLQYIHGHFCDSYVCLQMKIGCILFVNRVFVHGMVK